MAWVDTEKIMVQVEEVDYYFLEMGLGGYTSCDKYGVPIDKENPPEAWDLLGKLIYEAGEYEEDTMR